MRHQLGDTSKPITTLQAPLVHTSMHLLLLTKAPRQPLGSCTTTLSHQLSRSPIQFTASFLHPAFSNLYKPVKLLHSLPTLMLLWPLPRESTGRVERNPFLHTELFILVVLLQSCLYYPFIILLKDSSSFHYFILDALCSVSHWSVYQKLLLLLVKLTYNPNINPIRNSELSENYTYYLWEGFQVAD